LHNSFRISQTLRKRAAQIEVLLMDVDGTMTEGGVTLMSQTEEIALEIKTFDAHDGQGLTLSHTAGLRTGCITGRQSSALFRRAREMDMEFIYMKQPLKMPAYEEILRKAGVRFGMCAQRASLPRALRMIMDCERIPGSIATWTVPV
jgi:3-deoxy-D-manno-octulosonate 8-phosphate phosphatase (KDO 8-P phosphatase)